MNYRGTIGFDTLPYINVVHEMIVVVDYNIYIYVYTYMISMIVSFRYDVGIIMGIIVFYMTINTD